MYCFASAVTAASRKPAQRRLAVSSRAGVLPPPPLPGPQPLPDRPLGDAASSNIAAAPLSFAASSKIVAAALNLKGGRAEAEALATEAFAGPPLPKPVPKIDPSVVQATKMPASSCSLGDVQVSMLLRKWFA